MSLFSSNPSSLGARNVLLSRNGAPWLEQFARLSCALAQGEPHAVQFGSTECGKVDSLTQAPPTVDPCLVFLPQSLPGLGIVMVQNLPGLINGRAGEFPLMSRFRQEKAITKSLADGGLGLSPLQLKRVQQELRVL